MASFRFTVIVFYLTMAFSFSSNIYASHKKKLSRNDPHIEYKSDATLVFKNIEDIGFGAIFFSLLKVLDDFDTGKFKGIQVVFDNGCYVDTNVGSNWWDYFFEPINLKSRGKGDFILDQQATMQAVRQGYRIPTKRVDELIKKYITFRPEISFDIDNFIMDNFQGYYVIGIHHRGTDKKTEAKLVSFNQTLEVLNQQIKGLSSSDFQRLRLFVATDEAAFVRELEDKYPGKVVYNKFVRSTDGMPLHYSQNLYNSNYQKGKEAILDCFLLSKCDLLIFPAASSFSFLASKLNPKQKTIGIRASGSMTQEAAHAFLE